MNFIRKYSLKYLFISILFFVLTGLFHMKYVFSELARNANELYSIVRIVFLILYLTFFVIWIFKLIPSIRNK